MVATTHAASFGENPLIANNDVRRPRPALARTDVGWVAASPPTCAIAVVRRSKTTPATRLILADGIGGQIPVGRADGYRSLTEAVAAMKRTTASEALGGSAAIFKLSGRYFAYRVDEHSDACKIPFTFEGAKVKIKFLAPGGDDGVSAIVDGRSVLRRNYRNTIPSL